MIKQNKPFGFLCLFIYQMINKLCLLLRCNSRHIGDQEQGLSLNTIRNCASRQEGCLSDTDYL